MAWFGATFPGIQQIVSATYTLSHGIQPGQASVVCVPQASWVGLSGDLVFLDLLNPVNQVAFRDCKVDKSSIKLGSAGRNVTLSIWDRRWRWAFGWISGHYNFFFVNGPPRIDPDHEQTPQQLAALCLDQMGEVGYDVSELPDDSRPEVDWDYRNPAQALQELIEPLGCRVVLRLDNTVKLCLIGTGADLPAVAYGVYGPIEDGLTIDPPERPDSILFMCRAVFQQEFDLESIGLDTDGNWKPIDDLSYRPAKGWEFDPPPHFANVHGPPATVTPLKKFQWELAKQTVHKNYRIMVVDGAGDPIELKGAGPGGTGMLIESLAQLLPVYDEQVEEVADPVTLKVSKKPAQVFGGTFTDSTLGYILVGNSEYKQPFTVNKETGVVEFADYVYAIKGTGAASHVEPATISLRTSVSIRDPGIWAWIRYQREVSYGTAYNTGPRVLPHLEIQAEWLNGVPQNLALVQAEADHYILGADQDYQLTLPQERTYPGLIEIDPDGAIAQVSWFVSSTAVAGTGACRNTEFANTVHPWPVRRIFDYLRGGGIREISQAVRRIQGSESQERGK